jgi:hypothetical protein
MGSSVGMEQERKTSGNISGLTEVRFYQPVWILQFLRDEIQEIPASVGEQAGVEGYGNTADTVVSFKGLCKMRGVSCRDTKYKEVYCNRAAYNLSVLDFKLSPFFILSVLSFGSFPGVWFTLADDRLFRNVGQYRPDAGGPPNDSTLNLSVVPV